MSEQDTLVDEGPWPMLPDYLLPPLLSDAEYSREYQEGFDDGWYSGFERFIKHHPVRDWLSEWWLLALGLAIGFGWGVFLMMFLGAVNAYE